MSKFSKFLRQKREQADLSMGELGRLSGVSKTYISQVENEERNVPTPEILKKLAPHLKVSYEEMMRAANYIDIPADPKYADLKAVSLRDEYIAKGLSESDIRRILDSVLEAIEKAKRDNKSNKVE